MAGEPRTIQQTDDDEVEIDLGEVLFALKRRLLILILIGILGGAGGFLFSKVILTPTYTSTSTIFIMSKETTIASLTDLQIGSQLTNDYSVLIKSRTVMENTIDRLGLDLDYLQLRGKVAVENPADTRILNISVTDNDRMMAKTIADEVAHSASDYIAEIMEQAPPKIIEQGEVPLYQTSPNTKMNTLVGALLGILLVSGCVVLSVVLNDTVKTEDDVERTIGIPVLAAVPASGELSGKKHRKQGKRNSGGKAQGQASRRASAVEQRNSGTHR